MKKYGMIIGISFYGLLSASLFAQSQNKTYYNFHLNQDIVAYANEYPDVLQIQKNDGITTLVLKNAGNFKNSEVFSGTDIGLRIVTAVDNDPRKGSLILFLPQFSDYPNDYPMLKFWLDQSTYFNDKNGKVIGKEKDACNLDQLPFNRKIMEFGKNTQADGRWTYEPWSAEYKFGSAAMPSWGESLQLPLIGSTFYELLTESSNANHVNMMSLYHNHLKDAITQRETQYFGEIFHVFKPVKATKLPGFEGEKYRGHNVCYNIKLGLIIPLGANHGKVETNLTGNQLIVSLDYSPENRSARQTAVPSEVSVSISGFEASQVTSEE